MRPGRHEAGRGGRDGVRRARLQPAVESSVVSRHPVAQVRGPPHGGEHPAAADLLADHDVAIPAGGDTRDVGAWRGEGGLSLAAERLPGHAVGGGEKDRLLGGPAEDAADGYPARRAVGDAGQVLGARPLVHGGRRRRHQRPGAVGGAAPDSGVAVGAAHGKPNAARRRHGADRHGALLTRIPGEGAPGSRRSGPRAGVALVSALGEHLVGLARQHHDRAGADGDDDRGRDADPDHLPRVAAAPRRPRAAGGLADRSLPGTVELVRLGPVTRPRSRGRLRRVGTGRRRGVGHGRGVGPAPQGHRGERARRCGEAPRGERAALRRPVPMG